MYQPGYPAYPGPPQGYAQYPQPGYPAPGGGPQQFYVIASRLHNLALDVERNEAKPGARVMPWNRHGKDNQLWYDDPSTGTIRTKLNGFCLDIEGDSLRIMPHQPGDPNQQWERDPEGYIRNRVQRNKVLDIFNQAKEPGAKVGMWDANGGANQLWNFEFVGGSQPGFPGSQPYSAPPSYPGSQPYPTMYPANDPNPGLYPPPQGYQSQPYPGSYPPPQGYSQGQPYPGSYPATGAMHHRRDFFIVSDMNGLVLDVKGNNSNPGAEVIMWNRKQQPEKNQLWYINTQGAIVSALNDFALDAPNGQKLKLQPFNGAPHQIWMVDGNKIVNRSGECLDICGQQRNPGADVCSWRFKDSQNQHWHIEYVN